MLKFRHTLPVLALIGPTVARAQEAVPGGTPTETAIPSLMFFTLGAALIVALGALLFFLRKRSNRAAADRALNPNNPRNR